MKRSRMPGLRLWPNVFGRIEIPPPPDLGGPPDDSNLGVWMYVPDAWLWQDVAGLIRADTHGDDVARADDDSGLENHLYQIGILNNPEYRDSTVFSDSLLFDGNDALSTSATFEAINSTMYAVIRTPSDADTIGVSGVMGVADDIGLDIGGVGVYLEAGEIKFLVRNAVSTDVTLKTSVSNSTKYIVACRLNGTTFEAWVNGVSLGTTTLVLTAANRELVVGRLYNDVLDNYWTDHIAEVILYTVALSDVLADGVNTYLNDKWSIH